MSFSPGTRLGSYEILAPLGVGGMGEVYRARDARLGREVAIKTLPEAVAADPERLARFDREARLLASLNHPNVATLHGFEREGHVGFLVMELVPGVTLAERIANGAIPLDEAIPIFVQIADGLEAAHERGVIHRDLKPANITLTPEGRVKILDFGLAKALVGDPSDGGLSHSPTLSAAATLRGEIMGTAGYMSPEQARGKAVDRRTDIWAFGCVLYEALTGSAPFTGETITDTLAAIVRADPDWATLPVGTPVAIRRLLVRCLEKNPARRLRDIGDARIELTDALSPSGFDAAAGVASSAGADAAPAAPGPRIRPIALVLAATLSALAAGVAVWLATRAAPPPPETAIRFTIPSPDITSASTIAVSPDGKTIVFAAGPPGDQQLFARALDQDEPRLLSNTERGYNPFFSPDGDWVAFFSERSLKKISLSGGPAVTLCGISGFASGDWGADGTILLACAVIDGRAFPGLARVPAAGGAPVPVTTVDKEKGEREHFWPEILPGGRAALFTVQSGTHYRLEALSFASGERKILIENASYAHYISIGQIAYYDDTADPVFSVPFDAASLRITGPASPVVDRVHWTPAGGAVFDVSRDGTLVYLPPLLSQEATVVWVDREGAVSPLIETTGTWAQPRISPDGTRLLLRRTASPNCDLWLFDIARGSLTRATFEGDNHDPVWTPDGTRFTCGTLRDQQRALYWQAADGGGAPESLIAPGESGRSPSSWTRDGRTLAFVDENAQTGNDLWILPLEGERKPRPFLASEFNENSPQFSPDGRWIAYTSNESGRNQIYVREFPGGGAKYQVSTNGGTGPLWSRDGRELFYANGRSMMSVAITTTPALSASAPRALFEGDFIFARAGNYDISPDGRRFAIVKGRPQDVASVGIHVVLGWFGDLRGQANRTPRR